MKQPIYLFILVLFGCNREPNSDKSQETLKSDSTAMNELPAELLEQAPEHKMALYLDGIYEYDYPHDTEDMNENQYIAFKKKGDSVQAWYFGTSDEFDEAREGYLPGYFVSHINDLTTRGDSVFFTVSTKYDHCYSVRFPIGLIDTTELNKQYEKWNVANGDSQPISYAGKLDGFNLYIAVLGETRTYRKTRNYFHPGIDNYDTTKCQMNPLLAIDKNIEHLNEKMVFDFLSTFSVICEANAEFGEWSNELLFKTLSQNPALVLKVLTKNLDKLDTAIIFSELASPIHDLIPIDSISTKIKGLDVDERIKKTMLEQLGKAK